MDETSAIERVQRTVALVRFSVARAGEALERANHQAHDHNTRAAIDMSRAAVARSRALLKCPRRPAANCPAATGPPAERERQEYPAR